MTSSTRLGSVISARVHESLLAHVRTAHDRACMFAAWNLMVNWRDHFGNIAARVGLDERELVKRVDRWIDALLDHHTYQSPHVLGVKLRTMIMRGR